MSILVLQIFVSLILVAGSVVLFVHTVRSRTLEHADRLALAPLDDDAPAAVGDVAATAAVTTATAAATAAATTATTTAAPTRTQGGESP